MLEPSVAQTECGYAMDIKAFEALAEGAENARLHQNFPKYLVCSSARRHTLPWVLFAVEPLRWSPWRLAVKRWRFCSGAVVLELMLAMELL